MAIRNAFIVLSLLVPWGPALATEPNVSRLEHFGKAIYERDRAAWLATDRLLEDGPPPDGLLGWVTLGTPEGWRVRFVEAAGEGYCSRLSVVVDGKAAGPLRRSETCESLPPEERAMFSARQTALAALRQRCSSDYNTVVLPHDGAEAAWAVYVLAATREPGEVVVGGHVRVLVRDGGADVAEYRSLSNTCLTLRMPPPEEGKPSGLVVSHVLDDHPIETHVFLSLLHKLPLHVITESAMWAVADGKIRLLLDGEDFKAYLRGAEAALEDENAREEAPKP